MSGYDWLATHYHWMYEGDYEAAQNEEERWLATLLTQFKFDRVLDASCGDGFHLIPLALQGFNVVGSDLSPQMIAQARKFSRKAGVHVPLHEQDVLMLDQQFDSAIFHAVLLMGHTLSHLLTETDLSTAIEQASRVLVPGGLIFVDLPEWDVNNDPLEYSDGWIEKKDDSRELFFSVREYDEPLVYLHCFHLKRCGQHTHPQHTTIPMRIWEANFFLEQFALAGFSLIDQAESSYGKGTRFALQMA